MIQILSVDVLSNVIKQDWGWIFLFIYTLYQIYAPKIGIETRFYNLFSQIESQVERSLDRIEAVEQLQKNHIQVTRAMVHADEDEELDHEAIDQYLIDNGITPQELIDRAKNNNND